MLEIAAQNVPAFVNEERLGEWLSLLLCILIALGDFDLLFPRK